MIVKLNNYTVKYDCETCGELLIKENEIEEHNIIHKETMQFEEAGNTKVTKEPTRVNYDCELCGELFFTENERREHEIIHQTTIQDEETSNLNEIVKNKQSGYNRSNPQDKPEPRKIDETTVYCEQCGKEFKNKSILISHIKNHKSKIGSHSCSSCMEVFSNKEDLTEHMKLHSDGDHNCQLCDFESNTKEALEQHMNIKHLKKSPLNCNICDTQFQMRYQLRNHMTEQHRAHKPCSKYALNKCEFDSDCRFNHIILEPNQLICFECGNITNSKTSLMKHIETEHGSIPCNKYAIGKCPYGDKCLYKHSNSNKKTKALNENSDIQDFCITQPNLNQTKWSKLPSLNKTPDQTELIKTMMALMTQIINMNNS